MRTSWPLLVLALAACEPDSPATASAPEYAARLEPLLHENGLLAEELLTVAASVHSEQLEPADVQASWSTRIVPLSRNLADQAAVTVAPEEWSERHELLVAAWTERADAYAAVQTAVDDGDRAAYRSARKAADEAKLREEDWFRTTNRLMAPAGLSLDQFP